MKTKLLFLFCIFLGGAVQAQTFVSTEPSKKNVVIEEYTGVNCSYCPDGHKIANQIAATNPGRVSVINIHQGSYAVEAPYYKSPYGDALAKQTGLTGFPSGTVNRHVFPSENKTALGRGNWTSNASSILKEDSYVNIAAKAVIDSETRKLTVNIEIYYTDDCPVQANNLNVALLQNNILGPQSGSSYNPSYEVNGQYKHMHMLRRLLTGQWGETIEQTSEGSFVEKTFEYTIPEKSFGIPYVLKDLEIVVFIAEGKQEIITAAKSSLVIK